MEWIVHFEPGSVSLGPLPRGLPCEDDRLLVAALRLRDGVSKSSKVFSSRATSPCASSQAAASCAKAEAGNNRNASPATNRQFMEGRTNGVPELWRGFTFHGPRGLERAGR